MNFVLEAAIALIWQGALLVALALVAMRALSHQAAATRHRIWWGVLVVSLIVPVAVSRIRMSEVVPSQTSGSSGSVSFAQTSGTLTANDAASPPLDGRVIELHAPLQSLTQHVPALSSTAPVAPAIRVFRASRQTASFIAWSWALLALMMCIRAAFGFRRIHALRRHARPLDADVATRLLACTPLASGIALLVSNQVSVPVALGFRTRAILFPEEMAGALRGRQLEHVFLHELAHLVRRDDWGTLVLRVLQSLFFFLPAVQFAARRIEFEQEMACDEWALRLTGSDARDYAESLVRVGELALTGLRVHSRGHALAPSAGTQLSRRVGALLARGRSAPGNGAATLGFRALALPLPVFATVLLTAYAPKVTVSIVEPVRPVANVARQPLPVSQTSVTATRSRTDSTANTDSTALSHISALGVVAERSELQSSVSAVLNTVAVAVPSQDSIPGVATLATSAPQTAPPVQSPDSTRDRPIVRIVTPPQIVDTSRIVKRSVITIPHAVPSLPGTQADDSIAALIRSLNAPDAIARSHAAFALSEWRSRAVSAIPALMELLVDDARVSRAKRRTSDAWWSGDAESVTSPGEEAAKALLFIGPHALEPMEQFVATHQGESFKRAQWVVGLL